LTNRDIAAVGVATQRVPVSDENTVLVAADEPSVFKTGLP